MLWRLSLSLEMTTFHPPVCPHTFKMPVPMSDGFQVSALGQGLSYMHDLMSSLKQIYEKETSVTPAKETEAQREKTVCYRYIY